MFSNVRFPDNSGIIGPLGVLGSAHVKESAVIIDSLEMHSNENQRFPTALTFKVESLDFIH